MVYLLIKEFKEKKNELHDMREEINLYLKRQDESWEEIRRLEEKLKIKRKEIDLLQRELKNLNIEMKRLEHIVENATIIESVIDVGEVHNVSNGLVGLNRDILMKLIKLIECPRKIRIVIGMVKVFFEWCKLPIFRWARSFRHRFEWSSIYKSDGIIVSNGGKTAQVVVVGLSDSHLVVIDGKMLTRGVGSVSVKIERSTRRDCCSFGILLEMPKTFHETFGAMSDELEGWGLYDGGETDSYGNYGVYIKDVCVAPSTMGYAEGDIVTMRVDVDRGDLEYAVNGTKCAELRDVAEIRRNGVYLVAQMYNTGTQWTIVEGFVS